MRLGDGPGVAGVARLTDRQEQGRHRAQDATGLESYQLRVAWAEAEAVEGDEGGHWHLPASADGDAGQALRMNMGLRAANRVRPPMRRPRATSSWTSSSAQPAERRWHLASTMVSRVAALTTRRPRRSRRSRQVRRIEPS